MDKEVIRLLYEPGIPIHYSRKQFEHDFGNILYHKDAKKKLINYVKKNKIPLRYLEYLRDNSFNDSLLFKYSGPVFVKLKGDFQPQDLEFCKQAVKKLNTVSDQFQLEIVPDNSWYNAPYINIQFKEDTTLQSSLISERFLTTGKMMFTRRVRGTVKIRYKETALLQHKNKLLFKSMYKLLGLDHGNDDIIEIDSANKIVFKSNYKEILSLLYNPVIPNGFTQKEMDDVVNTLKYN